MSHTEKAIRTAYAALTTRPGEWVRLADLRNHAALSGILPSDVTSTLIDMHMSRDTDSSIAAGRAMMAPESYRKLHTDADRAAAIQHGEDAMMLLVIEAPEPAAAPVATSEAKRDKPLSGPMQDMMLYVARNGRTHNHGTTARALVRRGLITSRQLLADHSGLLINAQLTEDGWQWLQTHAPEVAATAVHRAALNAHERNDQMRETARSRAEMTRAMLAAGPDAQWRGVRRSTTARTDEDIHMSYQRFGPWTGLVAARAGIVSAIYVERRGWAAQERNRWNDDDALLARLDAIAEGFSADPNALASEVDGLRFELWTDDRPRVIDNAEREAYAEESERAALRLRTGQSVVLPGGTGRVLYHQTDSWVRVRCHDESPLAPQWRTLHRAHLTTTADLWADVATYAETHSQAFYVRDGAYVATDPDARSIAWSEHLSPNAASAKYYAAHDDNDKPIMFCMLASYGDYSNSSTYDASNYRVLRGIYVDGLIDPLLYEVGTNERDGLGVAVRIGDPRWSIDQVWALANMVRGLADYPVLDEMDLSEYESELAEQWWQSSGEHDVHSLIDDHFAKPPVLLDSKGQPYTWETAQLSEEFMADNPGLSGLDRDDMIKDLFLHDATLEPQSATEVYCTDFEATAEHIARTLFAPVPHVGRIDAHSGAEGTTCPASWEYASVGEVESGHCLACDRPIAIEYNTREVWAALDASRDRTIPFSL